MKETGFCIFWIRFNCIFNSLGMLQRRKIEETTFCPTFEKKLFYNKYQKDLIEVNGKNKNKPFCVEFT